MLGIVDQRFELIAHLEDSPLETVYYARDRAAGTSVLVRQLSADLFRDPEAFDLFLREYDQVSQLTHRTIIESYSLRRAADGRVFLVSEYVAGVSLRVFLDVLAADEQVCPPSLAVYITGEIARALQTAHESTDRKTGEPLALLHLDVCPTSILLSSAGRVKLKGFDLARLRHRAAIGDRPGRLAYLPPERIEGAFLDQRSELFSLGICLYELLTGGVPFLGRSTARIRQRIAAGEGDFAPLDRVDIPRELRSICRRAMAREPEDRYPSSRAFLADLAKVSSGKDAAGDRQLAQLLRRWASAERLQSPKEESSKAMVDIATTMVREAQIRRRGTAPPPLDKIPETSSPKPDIPEPEPIAALAEKGGFGEERPQPVRRSRRSRRGFWVLAAAVVILALVVDVIVGLTPLGRSMRFPAGSRPQGSQIVSVPTGAAVYLNDRYVGRTPRAMRQWPAGVTTIRLEYSGFTPAETILVLEDRAPQDLPTFVLQRKVSVRTQPPGAEVYINGELIPAVRTAGYALPATDTILIEVRKAGFRSPPSFVLAVEGPIGDFDPQRWQFEDSPGEAELDIIATLSRDITISSRPPGADIYLDGDSVSVGVTTQRLDLTLGSHQITLRQSSYLDYTFEIDVTEYSPERYTPVLGRFVRISAVNDDGGPEDIGAEIRWVRRGERLIKGPDDELRTPYSLNLEAADHEIMLACKGYLDTLVLVPSGVGVLTVVMRREGESSSSERREPDRRSEPETFRWVQFSVERSGEPVSGATIIGYETGSGGRYEFGTTGEEGQVLVKVPPGEFSFVAIKNGDRSNTRDSRIKTGRKIQSIKLKFR